METKDLSCVKAVVVLGACSSVARAIAGHFAADGYAVLLGDPDAEEMGYAAANLRVRHGVSVHTLPFDALAFESHAAFLDACRSALGGLPETLVVCFGFMADQTATQSDFALVRRTLDLNLTGVISVVNVFADAFEARKSGSICVLSSVAGDRGRKTNYTYGAAKAGLTAYLSGLRNRLHAAHVQVTTVKPGFMDTQMTFGMNLPGPLVASPSQAGAAIYRAIRKRRNVVYVRWFWRYIMLIIRHIPEWQFKKMSI
ncbi:MAG: decaprenylphospho-beta-D-erythro-pentofuranosid-2-ulose 2-reductase [Candidatus Hydrogenedentes bacterium]|nr:decaprenylphospho-beta-D-erythro-pentofuranosid-2-ulose 2-reductase [Candidatus Hydrogenedentota bacterium]